MFGGCVRAFDSSTQPTTTRSHNISQTAPGTHSLTHSPALPPCTPMQWWLDLRPTWFPVRRLNTVATLVCQSVASEQRRCEMCVCVCVRAVCVCTCVHVDVCGKTSQGRMVYKKQQVSWLLGSEPTPTNQRQNEAPSELHNQRRSRPSSTQQIPGRHARSKVRVDFQHQLGDHKVVRNHFGVVTVVSLRFCSPKRPKIRAQPRIHTHTRTYRTRTCASTRCQEVHHTRYKGL